MIIHIEYKYITTTFTSKRKMTVRALKPNINYNIIGWQCSAKHDRNFASLKNTFRETYTMVSGFVLPGTSLFSFLMVTHLFTIAADGPTLYTVGSNFF